MKDVHPDCMNLTRLFHLFQRNDNDHHYDYNKTDDDNIDKLYTYVAPAMKWFGFNIIIMMIIINNTNNNMMVITSQHNAQST